MANERPEDKNTGYEGITELVGHCLRILQNHPEWDGARLVMDKEDPKVYEVKRAYLK